MSRLLNDDFVGAAVEFVEGLTSIEIVRAGRIARAFHEAYEQLAPEHGYKTREASAVPWADVPDQNKALMVATVRRLIATGELDA